MNHGLFVGEVRASQNIIQPLAICVDIMRTRLARLGVPDCSIGINTTHNQSASSLPYERLGIGECRSAMPLHRRA